MNTCPKCGSNLVFDPKTHFLVCPTCGTVFEEARIALEEELNYSPRLAEALEEYGLRVRRASSKGNRRISWLETIYGGRNRRVIGRVKAWIAEQLRLKVQGIEKLLMNRNFRNLQELEDYLAEKLPELPLQSILKVLEDAYVRYGITRKPKPTDKALMRRTKEKAMLVKNEYEEEASSLRGKIREVFYLLRSTGLFSGTDAKVLKLAVMKTYLKLPITESEFRRIKSRRGLRGKLSTALRKIGRLRSLPAPLLAYRFGFTLKQAALIKGIRPDSAWKEAYLVRRKLSNLRKVDEVSLAKIYERYKRYKEVCELLHLTPLSRKEFKELKGGGGIKVKEGKKEINFGSWLMRGQGSWLLK